MEECKTNLDETNRALGEATSCRDSCLIALQNKQNEFEKYKDFNDRTIDYDILQTNLNKTVGLLALKDIEIKEGLITKAYEISVLNQKHDELVKKSLLTKSQLEGRLKEKTKVILDVKVKEEKDIDKMIEMDKQLKYHYKELYENTNQEWKWWIAKRCPSGYTWTQKPLRTKKIWMPKIRKDDVSSNISPTIDIIVQLILFIVDSGCTKHMTGNLKLLCNFVEKFLGTVCFGNEQSMTFEHSSSSLGRQCQMVSAENNTSGPVPQCSNEI
ncbi:hypothetical protein Tco_1129256 [Tanacetum coccineum]